MSFGERMLQVRLSRNLSQGELAQKTGISPRSLFSYEKQGRIPRSDNIQKIADALDVSYYWLLSDTHNSPETKSSENLFLDDAKQKFGSQGEQEASQLLQQVNALFAGGELEEEDKDVFFQSLMEVYLESRKYPATGQRKKRSLVDPAR